MEKLRTALDRYILNPLTFKLITVIAMFITSVPYLHMRVGGYVKILLAYGVLIIVYGLVTKRFFVYFKDKANWLLAAFCASYGVTVLLNRSGSFSANVNQLIYMAVFFILLFMHTPYQPEKETAREIRLFAEVVLWGTFVLSLIGMGMYLFGISGEYMTDNGYMHYGMYENRLWGLYNANTGATLNVISILLSVGLFIVRRRAFGRVRLVINLVLQVCCLILTGSRASLYALEITLACCALVLGVRFAMQKDWKSAAKRIGCGVLAAALTLAVCFGAVPVLKNGLEYLPGITHNAVRFVKEAAGGDVVKAEEDLEEEGIPKYDLTRIEEVEDRDVGILNGRSDIWKGCLQAFRESPVFGVGRENIFDRAVKYIEIDRWKTALKVGGPHNIYICVLLSSGIVGFILLAAFAVYTLFVAVRQLFKDLKGASVWAVVFTAMTVMFYIVELVEARILYQVGIFNVLFWICCGYMYTLARQKSLQNEPVKKHEADH